MKAQGTVKGFLVEGSDGHEYLLGFQPTRSVPTPVLSRRRADGRFEPLEDIQEASRFLWTAFKEALKALPVAPSWPTWRP